MNNTTEELTFTDVENIDESAKNYINKYKKEQNRECKWVDYRHGDQISLDAILEIIEMPPFLKTHVRVTYASRTEEKQYDSLNSGRYITSPNPREEFKNLLISNVPFEKKGEVLLFNKWELINWMEKEAEADPNFVYTLPRSFIAYCKKRKLLPSYSELLEENKELKRNKETLEKEIKRLQKKDSEAQNRLKIKIFMVRLATQIKKDMAKNHIAVDGVIMRAIFKFLNLKVSGYGSIFDSTGKEVKGLSVSFLRKTLIEKNLLSTNNKVGKKSKEMNNKEETILKTIEDLFKKNQYQKLYKEADEIKKMLKYKK